jgi:hypothetical protein
VFDRFHKGVSHSAFLNADFCRNWWIPILQGKKPVNKDEAEKPPFWLRAMTVLQIKWAFVLLAAFLIWFYFPVRKVMLADVGIVCSTELDRKTEPTARELLVVISSSDKEYIDQVNKLLHDESWMQYVINRPDGADFVSVDDAQYKLLDKYKKQNPKTTTDLDDPNKKWIAYTVQATRDVNKPTYVPIPTVYGLQHTTRFFIEVNERDRTVKDPVLGEINAAAIGAPNTTSLKLILQADIDPKKSPDLTRLLATVFGDNICWN